MGDPARRPRRLAAPTLAILAGLLYGLAEILRQKSVPSSPGIPGDSGGSWPAMLAAGILVFALPAWLVSVVVRTRGLRTEAATLVFSGLSVATAVAWRVADLAGWLGGRSPWSAQAFIVPGILLALLAGMAGARVAQRLPGRMRLPGAGVFALVLVSAGILGQQLRVPGPGHEGSGAVDTERPNLVLVTIDTLRRDALASYGGAWPTALDSVGADLHEGWASASWTQPSMASLFSGVVPSGHGSDRDHGPDPAVDWWVERLRDAGWETGAFVTNPYLRRRFGFSRGIDQFSHVEEPPWLEPVARMVLAEYFVAWQGGRDRTARADALVEQASRWLGKQSGRRPWFLWVHFLDPHLPYHLRGSGGAPGRETPAWIAPLEDSLVGGAFARLGDVREGLAVRTPGEREALRELYQTEVDYVAWWTRELLGRAQRASGDRELVWLVTSDHGEEFFEEGGFEHGHTLADPVVRVPMLSHGLGEGGDVRRLIDVGPWLLQSVTGGQAGFDPRRGSGLLDGDLGLGEFATGNAGRVDGFCSRRPMLLEGILYGDPRTVFLLPDGRRVERSGPGGQFSVSVPCDTGSTTEPWDAPWQALDFWRERRGSSPVSLDVDGDLRRRLRALGYTH